MIQFDLIFVYGMRYRLQFTLFAHEFPSSPSTVAEKTVISPLHRSSPLLKFRCLYTRGPVVDVPLTSVLVFTILILVTS